MLNKKILILFFAMILLIFMNSCEKDKGLMETNTPGTEIVSDNLQPSLEMEKLYFIDNKQVEKDAYDNIIRKKKKNEPNADLFVIIDEMYIKGKLTHSYYTTEKGYIEYGEKHNLNLKGERKFVTIVRNYARKNNIYDMCDVNGKPPKEYEIFVAKTHTEIFGKNKSTKGVLYGLFEDLNGYGQALWTGNYYIWFPPWFDDEMESVEVHAATSYLFAIYDHGSFQEYLGTYRGWLWWGKRIINLASSHRNKASSFLNLW